MSICLRKWLSGRAGVRAFPAWWCRSTGVGEIAVEVLIAFPVTRIAGLYLGAIIMAAATLTILRQREFPIWCRSASSAPYSQSSF
ncbi:MAG: hypothetical protein EOO77_05865 [Oxalobacteraceae bacterium]|nr:MAG: hypothetical protein EOO77_05865 [Oxalobacteraceae bacterium]